MSKKIINQVETNLVVDANEMLNGDGNRLVSVTGTLAVDAFLTPGGYATLSSIIYTSEKGSIVDLAIANNIDLNVLSDKIVNVWMAANYEQCNDNCNITSHGYTFKQDDVVINIGRFLDLKWVPAKIFEGKVEGDHIQMKVHNNNSILRFYKESDLERTHWNEKPCKIDITIDMLLHQRDYRYAELGNFEDAFNMACHIE
jgi:hypothetical protein